MAEQTGSAEVITLAEHWERIQKGEAVGKGTLILMPAAQLQQALAHLDEDEAAQVRQDGLAEQRRQITAQALAMLESPSEDQPKPVSLAEYEHLRKERKYCPLDLNRQITLTVREMIRHEQKRAAEILSELKPDLKTLWASQDQQEED